MKVDFSFFLKKFPEAALPVLLSEGAHHDFAKENEPLPTAAITQYIARYEAVEPDEFTEYVPCFRLPTKIGLNDSVQAVVYWKAGLLNYDYVLATYNAKTGAMIDKKAIAGMKVVQDVVKQIVATIDAKRFIYIAEGDIKNNLDFDADATRMRQMEILENGIIE
ncbi:MAG: hypothetical protein RL329_2909 [Bacteroidota bacterium]|jgi:hypothetical protein